MVKNLPAVWETWGLIPGLRKSPGEGNSLAWRIPRTVEPGGLLHEVTKSRTQKYLYFQSTQYMPGLTQWCISPLLSSSNERQALLGHPCTIMQVVYRTNSESDFFTDINVNGAFLPKVCNAHFADMYEESLEQLIGFIQYREKILLKTTHAVLLQIILGGAFHVFMILSK